MPDSAPAPAAPLRIGSLSSGYGGLDLAVEQVFGGRTAWFSELNPAPARVFAHYWPGIPNLGDITQVDWRQDEPSTLSAAGSPSTVGKRAGLAPGPRSGLWAQMATAIDLLQPEWVVAENVCGLLSATARRPDRRRRPMNASPSPQSSNAQPARLGLPFARWNPTGGIWETHHLDLYWHLEPNSAIWSTSAGPGPPPLRGMAHGTARRLDDRPRAPAGRSEQLMALGNGVLSRRAIRALDALDRGWALRADRDMDALAAVSTTYQDRHTVRISVHRVSSST